MQVRQSINNTQNKIKPLESIVNVSLPWSASAVMAALQQTRRSQEYRGKDNKELCSTSNTSVWDAIDLEYTP